MNNRKILENQSVKFGFHEVFKSSLKSIQVLMLSEEEDGKNEQFERPVLVIKTFNRKIFLGIPITSKKKENKYYFEIEYNEKKYYLILSQIRLFSNKRLLRKITKIDANTFLNIKQKLKEIINL